MPLTAQQIHLANRIDQHVTRILAQGGGDEALLRSLADHRDTFQQLLESSTAAEMDLLCQRYAGFHRFATLLERLAQGIADGTIPTPQPGHERETPP